MRNMFILTVVILFFTSCYKKYKNEDKLYPFTMSFEANGTSFDWKSIPNYSNQNNFFSYGKFMHSFLPSEDSNRINLASIAFNWDDTKTKYNYFSISHCNDWNALLLDSNQFIKSFDEFKANFEIGEYSFSNSLNKFNDEGVGIEFYYDGKLWTTYKYYSNFQPRPISVDYDRNYKIILIEDFFDTEINKKVIRVTAEFNCTLFNDANDSIRINNGRMCSLYNY